MAWSSPPGTKSPTGGERKYGSPGDIPGYGGGGGGSQNNNQRPQQQSANPPVSPPSVSSGGGTITHTYVDNNGNPYTVTEKISSPPTAAGAAQQSPSSSFSSGGGTFQEGFSSDKSYYVTSGGKLYSTAGYAARQQASQAQSQADYVNTQYQQNLAKGNYVETPYGGMSNPFAGTNTAQNNVYSSQYDFRPSDVGAPLLGATILSVTGQSKVTSTEREMSSVNPGFFQPGFRSTLTTYNNLSQSESMLLTRGQTPFAQSVSMAQVNIPTESVLQTANRGTTQMFDAATKGGYSRVLGYGIDFASRGYAGGQILQDYGRQKILADKQSSLAGTNTAIGIPTYALGSTVKFSSGFVGEPFKLARDEPLQTATISFVTAGFGLGYGAATSGLQFGGLTAGTVAGRSAFTGANIGLKAIGYGFGAYYAYSEGKAIMSSDRPGARAFDTALTVGSFGVGSKIGSSVFSLPNIQPYVGKTSGVLTSDYGTMTQRGVFEVRKFGRDYTIPFEQTYSKGFEITPDFEAIRVNRYSYSYGRGLSSVSNSFIDKKPFEMSYGPAYTMGGMTTSQSIVNIGENRLYSSSNYKIFENSGFTETRTFRPGKLGSTDIVQYKNSKFQGLNERTQRISNNLISSLMKNRAGEIGGIGRYDSSTRPFDLGLPSEFSESFSGAISTPKYAPSSIPSYRNLGVPGLFTRGLNIGGSKSLFKIDIGSTSMTTPKVLTGYSEKSMIFSTTSVSSGYQAKVTSIPLFTSVPNIGVGSIAGYGATSISTTTPVNEIVNTPFVPTTFIPPPIEPINPPGGFGFPGLNIGDFSRSERLVRGRRGYRYAPSLTAVFRGVKAPKRGKGFIGVSPFNIRGM